MHSGASGWKKISECTWQPRSQALGEGPSVGTKGKNVYNMATVHLAGRLTREPELKFRNAANGRTLVLLNLALNHRYQDGNGRWAEGEPTFVEVQCWGKLANNVLDCMGKGMSVLVIGRLVQSNWEVELDGEKVKRSVLRVKASHVGPDLNWQRARALKDEGFGEFEARGQREAAAASERGAAVSGAQKVSAQDRLAQGNQGVTGAAGTNAAGTNKENSGAERELVGAGVGATGMTGKALETDGVEDKPPF